LKPVEESPWPTLCKGRPITPQKEADKIRHVRGLGKAPYGVFVVA